MCVYVCVFVGEVRREDRRIVDCRTEVVVDDIQADGQVMGVRSVHETLQCLRPAVGLVNGVEIDSVISPAAITGKRHDRHQLDGLDAQLLQIIQLVDGRIESPLRGESAHM